MARRRIVGGADSAGEAGGADHALLVQPGAGGPVSRLQRTFNGLVEEVSQLERRLATAREDLEFLLERHQQRVAKKERALAEAQFALARALADAQARLPLRSNAKRDLSATICSLCEEAFLTTVPDAGTEAFYDEWADTPYREAFAPGVFDDDSGQAGEGAGAGPRDEDVDDDRQGDFQADPESDPEADWSGSSSAGRRSRADFAERQARRADQAERTRRSVREVYLALARVLHPDAVPDPAERQQREVAMKQATGAYRQNDLLGLLRLELQWIRRGDGGRSSPGDDTLRAWIRALREQVAKLEAALAGQFGDPRYDAVAGIASLPRTKAVAELERRARELRAVTAELVELRAMVHRCESRQELAAIVRGGRHDRGA